MITIRTLEPVREYAPSARDHVQRGGYNLGALERLLRDCDSQPDWRDRADRAHAYYDMGKQTSPERRAEIWRDRRIEPRETNLIHGVVNSVLGMEARNRSDVQVNADGDEFSEVADVLSMRMEEATRETNCDMEISDAYAGQVKGGLGWIEVSRASDPLDYVYRVQFVDRRDIWWDWRSKRRDLSDARWLIRKQWQDLDEAIARYPQFKDVLMHAVNDDWATLDLPNDDTSILHMSWENERRTTIRRDDWCDSTRERIHFYEVWYRVPAQVVFIALSPTRRVIYNERNPVHVQAVSRGMVQVFKGVTQLLRKAVFAGPHRLEDKATIRRRFPYIPFFGFRDDEDRSPYGLIEGMISPQDSYNERRQMVDWMLKSRQMFVDNDALDEEYNTIEDIEATASRPDFTAVLRADRKNANGLVVQSALSLQKEQLEVMRDDQQKIQDVPRIYSTMMGNAPAGVTAGVAIQSLTEAGVVAMGEMNDNYRFSRRIVHEELMNLIVEDHLQENLQVRMGAGENKRTVVLNTWDPETGEPVNRVEDAPVRVGLGDIPASPAFRAEEQRQMSEIVKALAGDPNALKVLAPAYIEGSTLKGRQKYADDLRRATGVPVAADRKAEETARQKQAQAQAEQEALAKAMAASQLEKMQASTQETRSKTELNNAKVVQIGHEMGMAEAVGLDAVQQRGDDARVRQQERADRAAEMEAEQQAEQQRQQAEMLQAQQDAAMQQQAAAGQAQTEQPNDEQRLIDEALEEALA